MRMPVCLVAASLLALPVAAQSKAQVGSAALDTVEICFAPPGEPGRATTRVLPRIAAEHLIERGRARPGKCPAAPQCGEPGQVSCADLLTLDEAAIRASEDAESRHDLFFQPGRPEIEIDLTSAPPRPSVMGQCIEQRLSQEAAVGFAYSIFQNGAEAKSGAGGWARAPWEADAPSIAMTEVKPMTIASISKIVTAVAIFELLEQHPEIDLDAPFYPLIQASWNGPFELDGGLVVNIPGPGLEDVTLRHLVIHRSGLETSLGCGDLAKILGIGTVGTPGVTSSYENHNYCLLREVIEEVSGIDYVAFVQANVLAPMGITMNCMPEATDPTLYYNTIVDPGTIWGDFSATCGAYGWTGSARQLAQLMAGFRLDTVLSAATRQRMLEECPFAGEPDGGRCLGFKRSTNTVGEHFYHDGLWLSSDPCKTDPGGLIAVQPSECKKGFRGYAVRMPLGIDATLFYNTISGTGVNPSLPEPITVLRQCFKEAFLEANRER